MSAIQKSGSALVVFSLVLSACSPPAESVQQEELEAEARELSQRFIGRLQPTLQQAMQTEGPVGAIDVCAVEAPNIARELSEESGWHVSRVSLRPRNTATAAPDAWEEATLGDFDERQQAGEPGADINASAVVDGEYRYMQAQPTGPLCLTCHGTELSNDVVNALRQYYPDDMATGYMAGEIRGAISLRRDI